MARYIPHAMLAYPMPAIHTSLVLLSPLRKQNLLMLSAWLPYSSSLLVLHGRSPVSDVQLIPMLQACLRLTMLQACLRLTMLQACLRLTWCHTGISSTQRLSQSSVALQVCLLCGKHTQKGFIPCRVRHVSTAMMRKWTPASSWCCMASASVGPLATTAMILSHRMLWPL